MKNDIDNKIEYIRKYYRKNLCLLELQFISYHNYNIYIRLDYFSKENTYRLSWFDLDVLDIRFIQKYLSFQYVSQETIDYIFKILDRRNTDQEKFYHGEIFGDQVLLSIFSYDKVYTYQFYKYIPKKVAFLSDLFILLFNHLPRKLQPFLYEIHAELENKVPRYEYKDSFLFDLFHDDINQIFAYQITERGKKYYEENRVLFLEKLDDQRYFAIVSGSEKYLVVIKYDEEIKNMQVYCSCPCEFYCKHIYSVILAIRNQNFHPFYKITYRNPNLSWVDRVLHFDYQLCIGIVEENLELINNDGDIVRVPIFDSDDKCNWQVLEDDEDKTLTKSLQDIVRNGS